LVGLGLTALTRALLLFLLSVSSKVSLDVVVGDVVCIVKVLDVVAELFLILQTIERLNNLVPVKNIWKLQKEELSNIIVDELLLDLLDIPPCPLHELVVERANVMNVVVVLLVGVDLHDVEAVVSL
jgi:hypothetical protein